LPVSVAAVFPNTLLEVEVTVFEVSTTELLKVEFVVPAVSLADEPAPPVKPLPLAEVELPVNPVPLPVVPVPGVPEAVAFPVVPEPVLKPVPVPEPVVPALPVAPVFPVVLVLVVPAPVVPAAPLVPVPVAPVCATAAPVSTKAVPNVKNLLV